MPVASPQRAFSYVLKRSVFRTPRSVPNPHHEIRQNSPFPSDSEEESPKPRKRLGSVARRRRHHQTTTLRSHQRGQTGETPPNSYAHGPSAWTSGDGVTKQLHSRLLSVDKRRRRNQTATLTAPQRSQTEKPSPNGYAENSRPLISIHLRPFPSSFSLPCPSVFLSRRSQTETAPPNHYAHGSSAWTSGDGVTK